ncbi:MAG: hypothetical protein HY908_11370, partial [Myxococcales bacterium]|nr:hypothetical protein [Myxococcales bacterium]
MSKSDEDEATAVVARPVRAPATPPAPAPATRAAAGEVDPDHLREAVAVSELTRMPDGGLAALRARRKKSGLDEAQLRRARDLLRLVGRSLVGPPDAARWQQIEAAWEALARAAPPAAPRDELPAPE